MASELTSNISKLNNNNFHRSFSISMNSLRRHPSLIVIFSGLCTKAILVPHSLTPTRKLLFSFYSFFMLCLVFLSFVYIDSTICCVRCARQIGQDWGASTARSPLKICLFVCCPVIGYQQKYKQQLRPHINCQSFHSIEKQMGTFCLCSLTLLYRFTHTQPSSRHSFILTSA